MRWEDDHEWEVDKDLEEAVVSYFTEPHHSPGDTEKTWPETRNGYLQNASVERYRYTNLLDRLCLRLI
jgi:hypothetical protein